jgi:hypothetical protein
VNARGDAIRTTSRRTLPKAEMKSMNATSLLQSTRTLIPDFRRAPQSFSVARTTAQALAWFSIALGALEVMMPRPFSRRLVLGGKEPLLRGYGGREIAAGVAALAGLLGLALWARIFGDLRDLATVRFSGRTDRHTARNISIAVGAVVGIALIDLCVAAMLSRRADR